MYFNFQDHCTASITLGPLGLTLSKVKLQPSGLIQCRRRIVKGLGKEWVHPLEMFMEHEVGWGRDPEFSARRQVLHNPNPTSHPHLSSVGSTQQNCFCLKCSQHLKSDSHQKLNLDILLKMESTGRTELKMPCVASLLEPKNVAFQLASPCRLSSTVFIICIS